MSYVMLMVSFFKIGLFGFGGGYVILALIKQEAQSLGVLAGEEFGQLVALSQVTPGPIAVNSATYVGYQYAGIPGAILATIAMLIPSIVLVLLVARFLERFQSSRLMEEVLSGVRPATLGMLASAAVFLADGSIIRAGASLAAFFEAPISWIDWAPVAVCGCVLLLNLKWKISPIKLTLLAAVAGAIFIR